MRKQWIIAALAAVILLCIGGILFLLGGGGVPQAAEETGQVLPTEERDPQGEGLPEGESSPEAPRDGEETPEGDREEPGLPGDPEDGSSAGGRSVEEILDSIYALRSSYVGQLTAIEEAGKAQYRALPAEQQTQAAKEQIFSQGAAQASALEDQCDARMLALCEELGLALIEEGGDLDLVNEVRYAYASEKAARESAYLAAYGVHIN